MASQAEQTRVRWLDRAAIGLSGLCLIHCIATAFMVALATSAAGIFVDPLIHEIGLALAIGLGILAFGSGLIAHGRKMPMLVGSLGLGAMAYALSLTHGVAGEVIFTVLGVCLVAIGHGLNRSAQAARA